MKKFLSAILALSMMLAMSATAFAAGSDNLQDNSMQSETNSIIEMINEEYGTIVV